MARVFIVEGENREVQLQGRISLASSGIAMHMSDEYGWSPLTMYLNPQEARGMATELLSYATAAEHLGGSEHGA